MTRRYPLFFLAAVLVMAAARAWTGDDAFITFRVAEQWLDGNGPVFNAAERVQVFTHPLWLFLLTAWAATGASLFPGAMWLSIAIFAIGLLFLYLAWRDKPLALATIAVLMALSQSQMDFATSGLETPLTFALFAGAVWALRGARPLLALTFLAVLPLNRLDLLPWVLPFAWIVSRPAPGARIASLAALCAPAAAWMAFSTIYYGSPFPNTAYAKLGDDALSRIDRGLSYVTAAFVHDPGAMALVVMGLVLAVPFARRASGVDARIARASMASAAIGLAYAIWTGGDFMLGRFILPVLWAMTMAVPAAFSLEAMPSRRQGALAFAVLAAFLLVTGQSTSNLWIRIAEASPNRVIWLHGAVDERRFYLPTLGAWAPARLVPSQEAPLAEPDAPVGQLGQVGYTHRAQRIVDQFALADPFLARIAPFSGGRAGHGYRPRIAGFTQWRDARHSFGDSRLDALASDLRLAHTADDLWSVARWRAIARLALMGPIVVPDTTTPRDPYEPPLAWMNSVPGWLVQGWRDKPRPAVVIAIVLLVAGAILWGSRR